MWIWNGWKKFIFDVSVHCAALPASTVVEMCATSNVLPFSLNWGTGARERILDTSKAKEKSERTCANTALL
jgi:hypothetical protein